MIPRGLKFWALGCTLALVVGCEDYATSYEQCAELCAPAGWVTSFSQEGRPEGGVISTCLCRLPEDEPVPDEPMLMDGGD